MQTGIQQYHGDKEECNMMSGEIALWKSNPEWYDYDESEEPFLTEKAPIEAQESFKKYLDALKREKETGAKII